MPDGLRVDSAIYIKPCAGDERSFRPCQKCDRGGDFFRPAISAQCGKPALDWGKAAISGIHIGVDRTRLNGVDGDAFRAKVARPATTVGSGSFRGSVVRRAGKRNVIAGAGPDSDDAAAFAHHFDSFAHSSDYAADIH
jgi:hypothetical protein